MSLNKVHVGTTHQHIQGEQKEVYSCEYAKYSLFLYCYLLVIVLFSIQITVNLLLAHPVERWGTSRYTHLEDESTAHAYDADMS